jgi:hypothetical protein
VTPFPKHRTSSCLFLQHSDLYLLIDVFSKHESEEEEKKYQGRDLGAPMVQASSGCEQQAQVLLLFLYLLTPLILLP